MNFQTSNIGEEIVLAPSKSYVAKAIPVEGGYIAQFSAPGLIPRYVARPHDPENPTVFPTIAEAEGAARVAVFGALNAPRKQHARGKNERYEKLSGPDFAVLLAESGLGLTFFAWLYGTSPDRVQSWIDGTDNAPHPARVMLEVFKAHPNAVDIAEEVTNAVTTNRRSTGRGS